VPTTLQPSFTPSDQLRRETSAINTPSQSVAPEQIKSELNGTIRSWISAGESRDIDSTMRFYADIVDYYRKPGSTKNFVQSDKQRYYDKFQTASVTISDLIIMPSADGNSAEALFDKTWVYDGNSRFSGKVRDQLKFRKSDGKWLITGERDLKVYYLNK
jgi:ketosteroid isomerase-like protein